jgi:hypothetical protein
MARQINKAIVKNVSSTKDRNASVACNSAKSEADALLLELEQSPIEVADTVLEGYVHLYAARFHRR